MEYRETLNEWQSNQAQHAVLREVTGYKQTIQLAGKIQTRATDNRSSYPANLNYHNKSINKNQHRRGWVNTGHAVYYTEYECTPLTSDGYDAQTIDRQQRARTKTTLHETHYQPTLHSRSNEKQDQSNSCRPCVSNNRPVESVGQKAVKFQSFVQTHGATLRSEQINDAETTSEINSSLPGPAAAHQDQQLAGQSVVSNAAAAPTLPGTVLRSLQGVVFTGVESADACVLMEKHGELFPDSPVTDAPTRAWLAFAQTALAFKLVQVAADPRPQAPQLRDQYPVTHAPAASGTDNSPGAVTFAGTKHLAGSNTSLTSLSAFSVRGEAQGDSSEPLYGGGQNVERLPPNQRRGYQVERLPPNQRRGYQVERQPPGLVAHRVSDSHWLPETIMEVFEQLSVTGDIEYDALILQQAHVTQFPRSFVNSAYSFEDWCEAAESAHKIIQQQPDDSEMCELNYSQKSVNNAGAADWQQQSAWLEEGGYGTDRYGMADEYRCQIDETGLSNDNFGNDEGFFGRHGLDDWEWQRQRWWCQQGFGNGGGGGDQVEDACAGDVQIPFCVVGEVQGEVLRHCIQGDGVQDGDVQDRGAQDRGVQGGEEMNFGSSQLLSDAEQSVDNGQDDYGSTDQQSSYTSEQQYHQGVRDIAQTSPNIFQPYDLFGAQGRKFINIICGDEVPASVEACLSSIELTGHQMFDAGQLAATYKALYSNFSYFNNVGIGLWYKYINIAYQCRQKRESKVSLAEGKESKAQTTNTLFEDCFIICSDVILPTPIVQNCKQISSNKQTGSGASTEGQRAKSIQSIPSTDSAMISEETQGSSNQIKQKLSANQVDNNLNIVQAEENHTEKDMFSCPHTFPFKTFDEVLDEVDYELQRDELENPQITNQYLSFMLEMEFKMFDNYYQRRN